MKNRLSKLQKWMLITCYERAKMNYPYLLTQEIFFRYYNSRTSKLEAALSRSIRTLIKQKLILGLTPRTIRLSNDPLVIMKQSRPDMATLISIRYHKEGKTLEDYTKRMNELLKMNKPRDKVLDIIFLDNDKIKALMITNQGKATVEKLLKLSSVNV